MAARGLARIGLAALAAFVFGHAEAAAQTSQLTAVEVASVDPVGAFNGVAYVRVKGVARGAVAPDEDVVGLAALPKGADGRYAYASAFELVVPAAGQPANEVIYV